MSIKHMILLGAALLMVVGNQPAFAAKSETQKQVEEIFNSMFGDKIRLARIKGPEGQLLLTKDLLTTAQSTRQPRELHIYLCEQTYDWAKRSKRTYGSAGKALKMLAQAEPGRGVECQDKLLYLYNEVFRTATRSSSTYQKAGAATADLAIRIGDNKVRMSDFTGAGKAYRMAQLAAAKIKSPLMNQARDRLTSMKSAELRDKKMRSAKVKFEKDPTDKQAALALTNAYMIDQDDPHRAAEFAEVALDDAKQELVALAVFKTGYGQPDQYMDLTQWYLQMSEEAAADGKVAMLVRAKLYCEHYLSRAGSGSLKGRLLLDRINRGLEKQGLNESGAQRRMSSLQRTFVDPNEGVDEPEVKPEPVKPDPVKPKVTDPKPRPPKPKRKKPGKIKKLPPPKYDRTKGADQDFWGNRPSIFDF